MLDPKPLYNFHEDILETIRQWRKEVGFDYFVLSYLRAPVPIATLSTNVHREVNLTIPHSPSPYKDWSIWFREYLQEQIHLLCKEEKVKLCIKHPKGYLIELE